MFGKFTRKVLICGNRLFGVHSNKKNLFVNGASGNMCFLVDILAIFLHSMMVIDCVCVSPTFHVNQAVML